MACKSGVDYTPERKIVDCTQGEIALACGITCNLA